MANKLHPEYIIQKQVCAYLRTQYRGLLFMSDTIAAVKLTIPQQIRNKAIQKPDFNCPDLLIFEPNSCLSGNYCGLFIELKAKSIYKKDGKTLLKNEHVEAQLYTIQQLRSKGYYAEFCCGFDEAKTLIDNYLKGEV